MHNETNRTDRYYFSFFFLGSFNCLYYRNIDIVIHYIYVHMRDMRVSVRFNVKSRSRNDRRNKKYEHKKYGKFEICAKDGNIYLLERNGVSARYVLLFSCFIFMNKSIM